VDWQSVLSLGVAFAAVVLSSLALWEARGQQRRDAFVRTQEFLLAADLQEGRRAIFAADRAGSLPQDDGQLDLIMRALGSFNTVAELCRLGAVKRDWVLDGWHHHLRNMRLVFESALAVRAEWHDFNPWADLDQLIRDAEHYASSRPCCRGPSLSERARQSSYSLLPRDVRQ
jgi:hypothetical protein